MNLELKGKKAIVTGGSRGIGRAICAQLVNEGAHVAFCARGQTSIDQTEAEINGDAGKARGSVVDVRDSAMVADWVSRSAADLGGIDILISNVSTRVDPSSANWWRDTFEADLMQHIMLKTNVAPMLEAGGGGSMVFIGSIASVFTMLPAYEEAYGAMKAGLVNLVGQWASTLGPKGIRVNAVSPGPIDFEGGWWDGVRKNSPAAYERASKMSALGRMGRPDEVAKAAVFLASGAASYITGANLRIDGALRVAPR